MPNQCQDLFNNYCGTYHRKKNTALKHLIELNKYKTSSNYYRNTLVSDYKLGDTKYEQLNIIYRPGMCFKLTNNGRGCCGVKHSKESAAINHLKKLGKGWDNVLINSKDSTKNRKKVYESKKYRPGMCFEGDNREKNCGVRHRAYNGAKRHIRKLQIKTLNMWNNTIIESYEKRKNGAYVDSYSTKADVNMLNNAYDKAVTSFKPKPAYKPYVPEPKPVPENSRVKRTKQIKRFVF